MIDAGKLSEGQQMPTEEAIGALFSVSRITVRQALDGLAQAGYIYKVQGKGSFVASKKAGMQLNHLIGFSDEMRSLGLEPSTILVEQSLMLPTEAVAKALNIDVTQKIYFLTRIRCADGVPMAVEKVHMPFYRFAGIETQDLSKSLYALLKEQYGCECSKAVQSIQAGAASSHDAKLLKSKQECRCCASPALRTVWMARPLSMWILFTAGINISLTSLWKSKLSLGLPRLRLGCAREKFFERYCYNNMITCLVAA